MRRGADACCYSLPTLLLRVRSAMRTRIRRTRCLRCDCSSITLAKGKISAITTFEVRSQIGWFLPLSEQWSSLVLPSFSLRPPLVLATPPPHPAPGPPSLPLWYALDLQREPTPISTSSRCSSRRSGKMDLSSAPVDPSQPTSVSVSSAEDATVVFADSHHRQVTTGLPSRSPRVRSCATSVTRCAPPSTFGVAEHHTNAACTPQLMRWSDDKLKSTFHRVTAPSLKRGDYMGDRCVSPLALSSSPPS